MDPITLTVVGWLVQPAAGTLLNVAQEYLLQRLGLHSSSSNIKPMLDEYLQRLTARIDEDRIAKLYGSFSKLRDAPKSVVMHGLLIEALDGFHEVAQIPQQGMTGGRANAELRSMAFVGMAASHNLLHDRPELVAEKMVEAVSTDANTAKQWLGESLVKEIISRLGVICPKCSFRNPPDARFCNRCGYSLISSQKSPITGQSSLAPAGKGNSRPSIRELVSGSNSSRFSYLTPLYQTKYEKTFAKAMAPSSFWSDTKKTKENLYLHSFRDVILALLATLQNLQMKFIALYDIPHGSMIEGKVHATYQLFGHNFKTYSDVSLVFVIDEEESSKIKVTGIIYADRLTDNKTLELVFSQIQQNL